MMNPTVMTRAYSIGRAATKARTMNSATVMSDSMIRLNKNLLLLVDLAVGGIDGY